MSFRTGLLASTSRALAPPLLQLPALSRRGFAASALAHQESKKPAAGSVQAADQQAAEAAKEREKLMRRMPMGIDMSSMLDAVVFEPIVDPKFSWSWLGKRGFIAHMSERVKRANANRKYAEEAGIRGLFPGKVPRPSRLWFFRRPAWTYPELLPALENLYRRYQAAQAGGDLAEVKATSVGPARERASKIARAVRSAQWELVRHNSPPKLVSVRAGAVDVDEQDMLVQVVVRFDTLQQLTARGKTRTTNVVENVLFDKRQSSGADFAIKDTLETTPPPFVHNRFLGIW